PNFLQSPLKVVCTALSSYSQGIQNSWLVSPSPHVRTKSTKKLAQFSTFATKGCCTALSSYSQGIQNSWLVSSSPHVRTRSTKKLAQFSTIYNRH
ncbi:hypothetical protein GBAR_LOCUS17160, partial [Geodia barretti]